MLLFQENWNYREKLRQAEEEIKGLKAKLPREGAVTLTGEQAEQWQAYQEFGNPDEWQNERAELQALSAANSSPRCRVASYTPDVLTSWPRVYPSKSGSRGR